jgi:DNA (cytosine-5)-methyltransferase 1
MAGLGLAVPEEGWGTEGVALGKNGLVEWCVLDAQWFGVAQRRRRVFAVLDAGDWANRPPILSQPESVRGHSAPSREAGKGAAAHTGAGAASGFDFQNTALTGAVTGTLDAEGQSRLNRGHGVVQPYAVANCLTQRMHKGINTTLDEGQTPVVQPIAFHPTQDPITSTDGSTHAMGCGSSQGNATVAVAVGTDCFNGAVTGDVAATMGTPGSSINASGPTVMVPAAFDTYNQTLSSVTHTLRDGNSEGTPAVLQAMQVRRLTPVECERLQGFPDNYTAIKWRGKSADQCPDGPRYKALGNSMAVPVMRWIGQQISRAVNVVV